MNDPFHAARRNAKVTASGVSKIALATRKVTPLATKVGGTAGKPAAVVRGYTPFDGIAFDDTGNVCVSDLIGNELWVLSPDGSKRALVANKKTGPRDNNNTSLAW